MLSGSARCTTRRTRRGGTWTFPVPGSSARQAAQGALPGAWRSAGDGELGAAGSGFTLLFEALLITFASAMPVKQVAKFTGEHDTRIWRVLEHYVATERAELDFCGVERVGVDETAAARGQDYVSVFMDADAHRVLFATPGRDGDTVNAFAEDLKAHGGYPEFIGNVTCDMSPAFISGVTAHLSNAEITFDRFHIMKKLGEAVDEVRRGEAQHRPLLL